MRCLQCGLQGYLLLVRVQQDWSDLLSKMLTRKLHSAPTETWSMLARRLVLPPRDSASRSVPTADAVRRRLDAMAPCSQQLRYQQPETDISLISSTQPVGTATVKRLCKMPSSSSSPAVQAALNSSTQKPCTDGTCLPHLAPCHGGTVRGGWHCGRRGTLLSWPHALVHILEEQRLTAIHTHLMMSKLAGWQHTHPRRCHRAVAGVRRFRITPLSSSRATG